MKIRILKIIDIAWALLFILAAFNSFNTSSREFDAPIFGLAIALFYLAIAFGLVRLIPFTRYLVYANAALGLVISIGILVIQLSYGRIYYPSIIPILLLILSVIYCKKRFESIEFKLHPAKEGGYFILFIAAVIVGTWLLFTLLPNTYRVNNLSGPVQIID